jgi:hypothetical protein
MMVIQDRLVKEDYLAEVEKATNAGLRLSDWIRQRLSNSQVLRIGGCMKKVRFSQWLLLAVGIDALMIVRRLWSVSKDFFPLLPYRTLSDWTTYDPEVFAWYAFFVAGIVGVMMARRNKLPLLYWNLWYLVMLAVASFNAPFGSSTERPLLIAGSIIAVVAIYVSHRQVQASALPN